jgi:peptide/nickel transport system permease protein
VAGYIARRLLWAVVVMACVGLFTFLLVFVAPGDPARAIVGPNATEAGVQAIRHALGLDRPIPDQLVAYLGRVLQGDLGTSYQLNRPVLDLILERAPATFELVFAGVTLAILIGVPLGIRSAMKPGGKTDRLGIVTTSVLVAMPAFWIGYVLIYLLAFQPAIQWKLRIFPIGQYEPWDPRYLFLPALTLALGLAAYYARLTRTALLEELHQDYVRTALAKGATDRRATLNHAFRNALPPVLTQLGLDLGLLLGGVVVIEKVFSWPGIGSLAIDSVTSEDLPVLMGTVLFATLCIVIVNLITDVAILILDPRIRSF